VIAAAARRTPGVEPRARSGSGPTGRRRRWRAGRRSAAVADYRPAVRASATPGPAVAGPVLPSVAGGWARVMTISITRPVTDPSRSSQIAKIVARPPAARDRRDGPRPAGRLRRRPTGGWALAPPWRGDALSAGADSDGFRRATNPAAGPAAPPTCAPDPRVLVSRQGEVEAAATGHRRHGAGLLDLRGAAPSS
jgi:hypothetical protein